jgi:hypothetical protein
MAPFIAADTGCNRVGEYSTFSYLGPLLTLSFSSNVKEISG